MAEGDACGPDPACAPKSRIAPAVYVSSLPATLRPHCSFGSENLYSHNPQNIVRKAGRVEGFGVYLGVFTCIYVYLRGRFFAVGAVP